MRWSPERRLRVGLGAMAVIGLVCTGCESSPPPTGRGAQTRPALTPATAPATSQPAVAHTAPSAEPGGPPPEANEPAPRLPDYLTIVSAYDAKQPTRLVVLSVGDQRLILDTRNVKRLRIDRRELPLDRARSVALVLDDQGLEWLPGSKVTEFERSPNGLWAPVKPEP